MLTADSTALVAHSFCLSRKPGSRRRGREKQRLQQRLQLRGFLMVVRGACLQREEAQDQAYRPMALQDLR